jgi:hypothetical protein
MGVARAQQFSWNRAARETLKVYRRAAERIVPRAAPLSPARYSDQPEPLVPNSLAAPGPDASRPCLRCGTALVPGDLQLSVSMRSSDSGHAGLRTAPRVWSCPRCGYVELVDETHLATFHPPIGPQAVPLDELDAEEGQPESRAVPDELELSEEPAAKEDEPVVTEAATLDEPAVTEAAQPDEPTVLEDEPLDEPAVTEAARPDDPAAIEAVPQARVAPGELELSEEPAAKEDEPVVTEAATLDEPVGLEARAVASVDLPEAADNAAASASEEQAERPDAPQPTSDAPTSVAGVAHSAHSPNSSNGSVPKIKSGRGSRRQPPAGEATTKQSPKRRSSGSKRKQTT